MTITNITMRSKTVSERYLRGVYHRVHKLQNSSWISCLLVNQYNKYTFTREGSSLIPIYILQTSIADSITISNHYSINFIHVGDHWTKMHFL